METGDVSKVGYFFAIPDEFKIKSLYNNDLILNIAVKSKETVQKLKFLDSLLFAVQMIAKSPLFCGIYPIGLLRFPWRIISRFPPSA